MLFLIIEVVFPLTLNFIELLDDYEKQETRNKKQETRNKKQENFLDWLSAHKLKVNELHKLLAKSPPQQQTFDNTITNLHSGYTANEAWDLSAKSLVLLLPQHKEAIATVRTKAKRCLSPKTNKNKAPFTLDRGKNKLPFVSCFYEGTVSNLMSIAHEFAHTVQIVASKEDQTNNDPFMPPLYRECCAFLGELALLDYLKKDDHHVHSHLKTVWKNENLKYLGSDAAELKEGVENTQREYSYNWNYPIARLYALMLLRQSSKNQSQQNNIIEVLFSSGSKAHKLVSIPKLTNYLPIPNPLPIMPNLANNGLTKYQRIGVITALYMNYHATSRTTETVEHFYQKLNQHLENKTTFIYFKFGKPVGYAFWESNKTEINTIVILELCLPYIEQNDFIKFMQEHYKRKIKLSTRFNKKENQKAA